MGKVHIRTLPELHEVVHDCLEVIGLEPLTFKLIKPMKRAVLFEIIGVTRIEGLWNLCKQEKIDPPTLRKSIARNKMIQILQAFGPDEYV